MTGPARIRALKPASPVPIIPPKQPLTKADRATGVLSRAGDSLADVLPRLSGNPRLQSATVLRMQHGYGNSAVARTLMRRTAEVSRHCDCAGKPREEQCEGCRTQATTPMQRQAVGSSGLQGDILD